MVTATLTSNVSIIGFKSFILKLLVRENKTASCGLISITSAQKVVNTKDRMMDTSVFGWILSHTLVPQPRRRVSTQAKGPLDLSVWQGGIAAGFFSIPWGSRISWCFCMLWWCELNCNICLVIRQTVTYLRSWGRKLETTIKIPCLSSRYLGNWSFGVSFYPLLTKACPVNTSRKDCNI